MSLTAHYQCMGFGSPNSMGQEPLVFSSLNSFMVEKRVLMKVRSAHLPTG